MPARRPSIRDVRTVKVAMRGAQLVQDLIDGARHNNIPLRSAETNVHDFFKTAGVYRALNDLGLANMEKEAFWGALARSGLSKLWKITGGKTIGAITKPIAWAGRQALKPISHSSPGAAKFLTNIGRRAARDAAIGGLLSGGLGAATATPEDRLGAFGRGFAGGALGGAAWRMGGAAAKRGLFHGLGKQRYMNLARTNRPGWFGGFRGPQGSVTRGLRSFGAKAAIGGVGLGGGLGATQLIPTFEPAQQTMQQRSLRTPYAPVRV